MTKGFDYASLTIGERNEQTNVDKLTDESYNSLMNDYYKANIKRIKETQKLRHKRPKTKAGAMWSNIIQRVENKNGRAPAYANIKLKLTKDQFLGWVIPELEKWCKTNKIEDVSLDRINTTKHYELGNLQLVTKGENSLKRAFCKNIHSPEGKAWCGKCKNYLSVDNFHKCKTRFNGLNARCKRCQRRL